MSAPAVTELESTIYGGTHNKPGVVRWLVCADSILDKDFTGDFRLVEGVNIYISSF